MHGNSISAMEQFELYNKSNENEAFTEDELTKKWTLLLETLNDRPNLKATLNQRPKLKRDNIIVINLDNLVQEELVRNNKTILVGWLRKELRNSNIDLVSEITQEQPRRIIYTDDEKLQEMVRKNPELAKLKEYFQLDFDN